jgi:hypothetical protein
MGRDLFERVTIDGREEHAVAIWKEPTDDGVNRSDSVSSWLRRAGAGRVLKTLGEASTKISLPHPSRSREWLTVALVECQCCHQVVERRSPVQRHCTDCRRALKQLRSRQAVARSRRA